MTVHVYYKEMRDALVNASKNCILPKKIIYYIEHIVHGLFDHMKEFHAIACDELVP